MQHQFAFENHNVRKNSHLIIQLTTAEEDAAPMRKNKKNEMNSENKRFTCLYQAHCHARVTTKQAESV